MSQPLAPDETLALARERIADVYRPDGVEIWMSHPNEMLGGETPIDLIARGEGGRVLDLIDVLRSGAFG
jgi:uncharacterized protein (DUF2384 family)